MAQDDARDREDHAGGRGNTARIDLHKRGGIEEMMARAGSGRLQPMRGFDEDYTDIVDYIVRCTHKIWDEGAMGLLYTHYAGNCVVHTAYGTVYGREQMLADSVATLAAFPERRSFADEVIWTGDDERGFHTSHRVVHLARNTGYSRYGPPTGRRIKHPGIANCVVKENFITEEWVVRDGLALVRQLGLDEHEVVEKMLEADERQGPQPAHGPTDRVAGQTTPPPNPEEPEGGAFDPAWFVERALNEVWNWRRFDKINAYFAPNHLCRTSPDRTIYGLGDYRSHVLSLIAAFPDARMNADDVYWVGDEREGYRVAVRWTLIGTHDGPGAYGAPTGKAVRVMGISHHVIWDGRLVKEWTVFDELALLKQLRG